MENKKIQNATPLDYKNIHFKSKLEVNIFKVLEEYGLNPEYEPITYTLIPGWKPTLPFYIKSKKTKKVIWDTTKIISIKYTPDIVFYYDDCIIFIEAKGKANDVFYLKKKLFRKYLEDAYYNEGISKKPIYAEVKSKKELLEVLTLLNITKNEKS